MKSNVDRMQDKEKTGVFTGTYAINPLNGAKVPIWLSDYVLADYGTGAIMCVPAHDDRDFEFAKKFDIPIIQVISKDGKEIENMTEAYTEASGVMINSGEWNGMESSVLKKEGPHIIEEKGSGRATVNYKLRDWAMVSSLAKHWQTQEGISQMSQSQHRFWQQSTSLASRTMGSTASTTAMGRLLRSIICRSRASMRTWEEKILALPSLPKRMTRLSKTHRPSISTGRGQEQ